MIELINLMLSTGFKLLNLEMVTRLMVIIIVKKFLASFVLIILQSYY